MCVDPCCRASPTGRTTEKAVPTEAATPNRGLYADAVNGSAASDDETVSSSDRKDSEDVDVPAPGVQAQVGSLAAALSMVVDLSFRAPPIEAVAAANFPFGNEAE